MGLVINGVSTGLQYDVFEEVVNGAETALSFNPEPVATAARGMDCPHTAPAVASGSGLNEPWQ